MSRPERGKKREIVVGKIGWGVGRWVSTQDRGSVKEEKGQMEVLESNKDGEIGRVGG